MNKKLAREKDELASYKAAIESMCEKKGYSLQPKSLCLKWDENWMGDKILSVSYKFAFQDKPLTGAKLVRVGRDIQKAIKDAYDDTHEQDMSFSIYTRPGASNRQRFEGLSVNA